ncbi:CPBP family glutamic-type intramembrane protease [Streptococcus suis]|nr:CPBP family glutamic-type intramembrane protease [Streptococcus suis]
MQPILEDILPFPLATLTTGVVWSIWHLPLWFIDGSVQQMFPFYQFMIYAIVLSFSLAIIYKKSHSIFFCAIFHGLNSVLIAYFAVKANIIFIVGLFIVTYICLYLYRENKVS